MAGVFDIKFTAHAMHELIERLARDPVPAGTGPRLLVTANVDHIVQLRHNAQFRAAYAFAWAVTADGAPVAAYARLRGVKLPRVPGSDLCKGLLPSLSPDRHKCFFVVSDQSTTDKLSALLFAQGFSTATVEFWVPPIGFERDAGQSTKLARAIGAFKPTHVFLGVGAPKSEMWTHCHRAELGDCYVLCVGAGLEYLAGTKVRAPNWMQRVGLEWTWRVAQEPRRLSRRYLVGSWFFVLAVIEDLRGKYG